MSRGSKPGERRGGRTKGTPNKATAEIQELTRKHAPEAVQRLVELMRDREHPGHVTAIRELLDRGYGKPRQSHEHTGKDGDAMQVQVSAADEILRRLDAIAERKTGDAVSS